MRRARRIALLLTSALTVSGCVNGLRPRTEVPREPAREPVVSSSSELQDFITRSAGAADLAPAPQEATSAAGPRSSSGARPTGGGAPAAPVEQPAAVEAAAPAEAPQEAAPVGEPAAAPVQSGAPSAQPADPASAIFDPMYD